MRIERGATEPIVVALYSDRSYVFGRSPDCSFIFSSDRVSRRHGQLQVDSLNRWVYRDLNSSNGTLLLEEPVEAEATSVARGKWLRKASDRAMRPGFSLLLGNSESRITFLAECPPEVSAALNGQSHATRDLESKIITSARHHLPVFLLGPAGSGKTYVARAIHDRSKSPGQFVRINCGALPTDSSQLRSELLGHVDGAFTGAKGSRIGRFQAAENGTLFLDEVESLPQAGQDLLLDVIERGGADLAPLGAHANKLVVPISFRLISASKRQLASSGLRPDLAQRLITGAVIRLPTLEDRAADIPALVHTFLAQLRDRRQIDAEIREEGIREIQRSKWPGQVRALEATVVAVATLEFARRPQEDAAAQGKVIITAEAVREYLLERAAAVGEAEQSASKPPTASLASRKRPTDLTADDIRQALDATGWNIEHAASLLQVVRNTLKTKMKLFGLTARGRSQHP